MSNCRRSVEEGEVRANMTMNELWIIRQLELDVCDGLAEVVELPEPLFDCGV